MKTTSPKRNPLHANYVLLLASLASVLVTSCAVPKPQPLSALGPKKIGPVSCQLDSSGPTNPRYENAWSQAAQSQNSMDGTIGGAVATLIVAGIGEAARAPGQSKLDKISQAAGARERQQILDNFRKQLTAAGYTVKDQSSSSFVVRVASYGINKGKAGLVYQNIYGDATLKDPLGKSIWTSTGSSQAAPSTGGRKLDEYMANPKLYHGDFEQKAKEFANRVVTGVGIYSTEYNPSKTAAKQ
jgi:hypothetical protein